jgi:hypothetical protein
MTGQNAAEHDTNPKLQISCGGKQRARRHHGQGRAHR